MMRRETWLMGVGLAILIVCVAPAAAVPGAGPSMSKSADQNNKDKAPDIVWPRAEDLANDSWQQQGDPLAQIAGQMHHIVGELAAQQTGHPVPAQQKLVLAELDDLIKQVQQQTRSSAGGTTANPTKPMQRSRLVGGPGGSGPLHDPRAGTRTWGQLPPKEREKILQSETEGFPPGYEAVLSSYYTRLAQVQASNDGGDSPATQPASGHP